MTLLFSENFLKTYVRPLWAAWAEASTVAVITTSDDSVRLPYSPVVPTIVRLLRISPDIAADARDVGRAHPLRTVLRRQQNRIPPPPGRGLLTPQTTVPCPIAVRPHNRDTARRKRPPFRRTTPQIAAPHDGYGGRIQLPRAHAFLTGRLRRASPVPRRDAALRLRGAR